MTLRLHTGASLRGKVYRPDGAPAAGRLLRLSQSDQGEFHEVRADDEGRFLAERLVSGRSRIDTFPDATSSTISAAMAAETRPATMSDAITGPSSRVIPSTTMFGTILSALKRAPPM